MYEPAFFLQAQRENNPLVSSKNIIPRREAEEKATNRHPCNLTVMLPEAFPWK